MEQKEDRSGEKAFFIVLDSTDLWKELKKWMFPNKIASNFYNYKDGDTVASHGYLDLIKENTGLFFTKFAIDNAARNGHLEVIKFIYEFRTEGCIYLAMNCAMGGGHLKVVKHLYIDYNIEWSCEVTQKAINGGYPDELNKFILENTSSYD